MTNSTSLPSLSLTFKEVGCISSALKYRPFYWWVDYMFVLFNSSELHQSSSSQHFFTIENEKGHQISFLDTETIHEQGKLFVSYMQTFSGIYTHFDNCLASI